ncbi:MAG: tail fiber domain-containing protein [Phycisphaerae bacterium]
MSLRDGYRAIALIMFVLGVAPAIGQTPLGTAFTYQGSVRLAGEPLNASADFQFTLWDAATLGNQIGAMATADGVAVADGLFTASIDFGAAAFNGEARWVEIAVRSPAGSGPFTTLSPRQALTATPYARFSSAPWATNGNNIFNVNSRNVGIGTTSPERRLHVDFAGEADAADGVLVRNNLADDVFGPAEMVFERLAINPTQRAAIGMDYTARDFFIWVNGADRLNINELGNVGIGTDNPTQTLSVNGSAGKPGGGSWATFSDRRLKKNIQPLSRTLDKVLQLHGVSFEYNDPAAINELPGERIGMVAQQVEQVFPDWVEMTTAGYKSVTFRGFEALTVEALRDLRAEKDAEIAALRAENAELKSRLDAIEAALLRINSSGK